MGGIWMFAAVHGMAVSGIQAHLIRVEVDVSNGLPEFSIVGLAKAAVRESRERVRSAIKNSGFDFPLQRITVNLAPADLKKDGSGLDLPIAIGILAATGQCAFADLFHTVFVGELSLEGQLRPVPGILAMAVSLAQHKDYTLLVPPENLLEANLIEEIKSGSAEHLAQLVHSLETAQLFGNPQANPPRDIRGSFHRFKQYSGTAASQTSLRNRRCRWAQPSAHWSPRLW